MSALQRQRRTNPYPHTWEVPAAALLTIGYLLVMGIHLGRGIACYTVTGSWQLTPTTKLFTAMPGILAGEPTAGLPDPTCAATSPTSLTVWITLVVLLTVGLLAAVGRWLLARFGPSRLKGMSTPADAEAVLGRRRLRAVAHIIRPDLHPRKRTHP